MQKFQNTYIARIRSTKGITSDANNSDEKTIQANVDKSTLIHVIWNVKEEGPGQFERQSKRIQTGWREANCVWEG